jgi:hypothetical protein
MRQRWRSLGHVHVAAGEVPGHVTHAAYPTPLTMPDGRLRVFFSPRDADGRSTIFSLDLELRADGVRRLGPPQGPWLEAGPRGAFDDAGTSVGWVGWAPDGGLECWYLGWSLGVSVPFRNFIGRALAAPCETRLQRASPVPVLDRAREDPFTLGYPWLHRDGGKVSLWYGTHRSWGDDWMAMDHAIRRAVSVDDGHTWQRDATPAIAPLGGEEWAVSRPCVLRDAAGWHMWFCRRFEAYRLGYAHSTDGVNWERRDAAVTFTGADAAWEAGTRCYPAVFDHQGQRWMLYNGTGYGRSGFGLAILENG